MQFGGLSRGGPTRTPHITASFWMSAVMVDIWKEHPILITVTITSDNLEIHNSPRTH